jgi:SAM-dependent methyltransferase
MAGPVYLAAREPRLWRTHSDATNAAFLSTALGTRRYRRALKTDLFDEAINGGLVPELRTASDSVVGIDIAPAVVAGAKARHPDLQASVADVRRLPFGDDEFDLVVSLSTLDHLASVGEMATAMRELTRVLAPGGTLALTVDNRANPAVALRNLLPGRALRRAGLVAYDVGPTVGPRRLERMVGAAGARPLTCEALMHCPRLPAVVIARRLDGSAHGRGRFLRAAGRFDVLRRLPTRYLTGYFTAIVAEG